MSHIEEPAGARRRARGTRIAWLLVGAAAVAIAASYWLVGEDAVEAGGAPRGRATPVAVAEVVRATLTERRRYPGELDADTADVASFYAGRVKAVTVRVGDAVKAGQVVAELDPVDAVEQIARARAQAQAAEAEARRASAELDGARKELARSRELPELVSASELDALRARALALEAAVASAGASGDEARAGLRLLQRRVTESAVRAPFAGRIAVRHVDPGVIVAAGDPLLRVVASAPLRIRFEVPEHDVPGLEVGGALRVVTQAGTQDGDVAARITGIGAEIDRARRIAAVEAIVDAPPPGWRPGMYAEAVVDRRTLADATVVPASAVLSRLGADGVIATGVLIADGEVARWLPVTVVAREDARVAIEASGLDAGARVLAAGHVDLVDGSRIQVTTAGSAAAEAR
jgi:multidrug efflux system membrane fusion protein